MNTIENISDNLSNRLGEKLNKTAEEVSVLKYGLFIIIHTLTSICITLILGAITGVLLQISIISFTSATIKRYSGGTHATSPTRCLIIGISLSMILSHICNNLSYILKNNYLLIFLVLVMVYCYITLYLRCPVPSKNKPMKKISTRKMLRKKAFLLVNLYYFIITSLLIIYINTNIEILKTITISISLGIFMQVFALSSVGEKFILKFDSILSKKCR